MLEFCELKVFVNKSEFCTKFIKNRQIINIENLANLDQCGAELFMFSCFPLKLENGDGSPVRAVAWFE